jgi:hypothetical protein
MLRVRDIVRNRSRAFLILTMTVAWSAVVLLGYYFWHKPMTLSHASALGRTLIDWLLGVVLVGLAGGCGRRIIPLNERTPWERFVVQAAVGLGIMSLLWLGFGVLGLYSAWAAWATLMIGWVLFRRDTVGWLLEAKAAGRIWNRTGVFGRILAVGSGILVAGQALFASTPPTKWDALMYHLELPRRYLLAGGLHFVEGNPYWGHPQIGEMIYTLAMALGREETAVITGFCLMLVLLLGIIGATFDSYGADSGWIAAAALLVGSSFLGMFGWGYVDGLAALYGLAALLLLISGRATDQALLVGCLIGFAAGVKLTAGVLLVPVVAVMATENNTASTKRWAPVLLAVLAGLVVFAPWLLKNLLTTGNPLYPHVWPTAWVSQDRLANYSGMGRYLGDQIAWLPLAATWLGVEGGGGFATDLGPLLVIFAVPGLLAYRRERNSKILVAFVAMGWSAIAAGTWYSHYLQQVRLYYVLLPSVALAAGIGWHTVRRIATAGVRLGKVLGAVTILVLVLSIWKEAISLTHLNPAGVLLGTVSEERYLDDSLGWYAPTMRALHLLPEHSHTLFLWEPRGLYAPPNAQADVWIDRWYTDRRIHGNSDAIVQAWRQLGFTHLLQYQFGADFMRQDSSLLTREDWQALDETIGKLNVIEDFGGVYTLYALPTGE